MPTPRFDQTTRDAILEAARLGASDDVTALHAGIKTSRLRAWLKQYPDFAAEVAQARAQLQMRAMNAVRARVAEDDRAAAQWMVERIAGEAELNRLRELTT